jgi:hypothetical protein
MKAESAECDDYYTNEAYPQLVGQGQVRVNGQEAELTCQFPPTFDIVSVINQNFSKYNLYG